MRRGLQNGEYRVDVSRVRRDPELRWQCGQLDGEHGAASRVALHRNFASMFVDDAADDRKPDTGADARWFGAEERIEDARQQFRSNAGAVVGDVQGHARRRDAPGAQPDVAEAAARFNGLLGAVALVLWIEHDLQELRGVGQNRRQVRLQVQVHANAGKGQLVRA